MHRISIYIGLTIAALCSPPRVVTGQGKPPVVTTVSRTDTVQVTGVYGDSTSLAPDALIRLRSRIAGLGSPFAKQRVIQPIIVYVPVAQDSTGQYKTVLGDPLSNRLVDRQIQSEPGSTDGSELQRQDAGYVRPGSVAEALRIAGEVVTERDVEKALLETGLFFTTNVIFEFDESTLLPVSERTLDVVGGVLARHPEVRIEVAGHTDSTGPDVYNQGLSEARAKTVLDYLINQFSLPSERIQARGYGEAEPLASNATRTGRTLNRRVEFRVIE